MNYDPRVEEFLVGHFGDSERVSHAELAEFLESIGLPVNPTIARLKADGYLSSSNDPHDRPTARQLAAGIEPPMRYRIAETVVHMPDLAVDDLTHDRQPENLGLGHRPMKKQFDPNAGPEFGYAWPACPLDLEKLKHQVFVAGNFSTSAKMVDRPGPPGKLNDIRWIYVPTEQDKALIQSRYPEMDPEGPLWWRIRADLITNGMDVSSLAVLTAPEVIAVLKRLERKPSPPRGAEASDGCPDPLAKRAGPHRA